jgi:PAS domain S-box-containing protein
MADNDVTDILNDSFFGNPDNLRSILVNINDAVYLTDRERKIVFWNDACERITGYSSAEVLGRRCLDNILNHTDMEGNQLCVSELCPLNQSMLKNTPSARPQMVLAMRSDGSRLAVEVSVAPLLNEEGEVIGGIEVFRDVTERLELEEAKARFFSGITHELRTPITVIEGYLEMMLDGDAGEINETQRSFIDDSMMEAKRLEKLVDDLLELSRLETTDFSVQFQVVDLKDVLEKVDRGFKAQAEKKGLKLEVRADSTRFLGDRDRLYQAFSNLVSNAIKYTSEGTISIDAQAEDGWAVVTVKDSGIGMAGEELERIFEHFYRAEDEAARRERGSGIGLSIVRRIVERHNGEIDVESLPGVGSTFTVRLPITPVEEEQVERKEEEI